MRVLKPRVKALLYAAIAELEKAGVKPTPEDVVWLHDASQRVVHGDGFDVPAFSHNSVTVGRITLHQLSIGAHIWLEDTAVNWWPDNKMMDLLCVGYAMAHARDAEALQYVRTKGKASLRIRFWAAAMGCTIIELRHAIELVLSRNEWVDIPAFGGAPRGDDETADPWQWGDVVARLCSLYHLTPEYVMWNLSASDTRKMMDRAVLPSGMSKDDKEETFRRNAIFKSIVSYIKTKTRGADGKQD